MMTDKPTSHGWWRCVNNSIIVKVEFDNVMNCDTFHIHYGYPMCAPTIEYARIQPMSKWDEMMRGHQFVKLVEEFDESSE